MASEVVKVYQIRTKDPVYVILSSMGSANVNIYLDFLPLFL